MGVEDKIKEHCNKQQKGVIFKREKSSLAILKKVRDNYWVAENPLFKSKNQGLFPVFKTGGPQGKFPKNHQEFILRNIEEKEEEWNI